MSAHPADHPAAAPTGLDPVLADAPHRIAKVTLAVRDIEGVGAFYREAIGLREAGREPGVLRLGNGSAALLELRHAPEARRRVSREAGLFHTAFLLPSRADLGAWLAFADRQGLVLQGAADHLVSEAVYLADPEGNGIEVYVDRPSAEWPREADGRSVRMANAPLDGAGLARAAASRTWAGFPDGGIVGHVHLQVGALEPAEAFYGGVLGFDLTCRYPGGSFFGSGGYHHQLAANVWNSRGAPPRGPERATGLDAVEIAVRPDVLDAIRARAGEGADRLVLRDPWNTAIALVPA